MNPRCERYGHLWKATSFGPKETGERCGRCDLRRERPATSEEKKAYRKWAKELRKPMEIHKLHHAFAKAMEGKSGHEAMKVAERWSEKYPERIRYASVDDDFFAGSCLTFVTHEDPKGSKYMGISVWYIPQCTGENPIRFFLYPGHLVGLLETLRGLRKASLAYPEVRREHRSRLEGIRNWKKAEKVRRRP